MTNGLGAPKRHVFSERTRAVLRIGGMALGLALLIFAISTASSVFSPKRGTVAVPPAPTAVAGEREYRGALSAIASGDTTTALDLLSRASLMGNTKARSRLAQLRRTATNPSPATPTALDSPVADIATLLPASVGGYGIGEPESDTGSAMVTLQPVSAGAKLRLVVLTVFDKGSPEAARAYVAGIGKAYPKDVADITIGDRTGKFGTDGARLASAVFARGRYAFEVVGTVSSGVPAGAKDATILVASSFPAAKDH